MCATDKCASIYTSMQLEWERKLQLQMQLQLQLTVNCNGVNSIKSVRIIAKTVEGSFKQLEVVLYVD